MLPSVVFTHLNGARLAAFLPEPVLIELCSQPASVTADQQDNASLSTFVPAVILALASLAISCFRNPLPGRPEESHLQSPTDPDVTLSRHPAHAIA